MNQDLLKLGDSFISHYGIKGMKWGVRRTDAQLARERGAKTDEGENIKVPGSTKSGDVVRTPEGRSYLVTKNSLSDEELRAVVNRMQMERQYDQLTAQPPGKMAAARDFMAGVAKNVARTQLQNLGNAYAAEALGKQFPVLAKNKGQQKKNDDDND